MNSRWILAAAFGIAVSPIAHAVAQEIDNELAEIETIEVTGTRLKGVDMEGAQPLVMITAEDIKGSSATNVSELLREIGQTRGGTGTFSTSASGALSGNSPAGQAAGSLRGLGASSTLTLINGRRVSVSSFAYGTENFVDVNAIPLAAIERIEILATGASAIYGADAVAGVINYILKQDYDGAEINVRYGNSEASSNNAKSNINVVWGTEIGDGHVTLYADYYDKEPLYLRDREQTAQSFFPSKQHEWASYNTLFFDLAKDIVDPNCPDDIRFDDRDADHPAERFYEYCAYNSNQYRPFDSAFEQLGAGAIANFALTDSVELFADLMYTRTKGRGESSSAPLNGFEVPFYDPRDSSQYHPTLLNSDGSLNPVGEAIIGFYEDEFGGVIDDAFQFYGRLPDTRTVENTTTSFRLVTGLRGDIGDWTWETAVNLSANESEQIGVQGIASRTLFEAALNGALCADGTVCEPGQGMLISPYNAWAPTSDGVNSPEAWAQIYQRVPRNGESKLYAWDFQLNGDILELEAGTVAAAFGGEVRREEIKDIPSPLAEGNFDNDFQPEVIRFGATRAEAERTSWALFGEFNVPVTTRLDLQLAGRYDHYSDFGGDFNPKVGLRYRATDALIVRGSWATSFRAPSLSQVGAGVALASAVVECKENVVAYANCDGQRDFSVDTVEFGNPNLSAEEAESFNAGLAYSPTNDITITLDYWQFEHDKLVSVDPEFLLSRALTEPGLMYCDQVPKTEKEGVPVRCDGEGNPLIPPQVDGDVHVKLQNLGNQKTQGMDVTYIHGFEMANLDWTFSTDLTQVFSFERQKTASVGVEELAGTYQYPKTLATVRLLFSEDTWFGGLTMLYTSGYEDNDLDSLSDFDLERLGISPDRKVPSWTKFNATIGVDLAEHSTLRFSIDNLFDRKAPVVYGSSQNVDSFNHDIMGRFYQLSYTYRF